MFHNYFTVATRNLFKHKGHSLINISGLAIGMACCMLLLLFVQHELSYDRFHKDADRIFRVLKATHKEGAPPSYTTEVSGALAPTLQRSFPEIHHAVRILQRNLNIRELQTKGLNGESGFVVDESFLDMFTFPFVKGNPKTALKEPYSVIITQDTAQLLFGDEEPIGKTITAQHKQLRGVYTITGVLEPIPQNSTLRFGFLISTNTLRQHADTWHANPGSIGDFLTYIQLPQAYDPDTLIQKLPDVIKKHTELSTNTIYHLQPLSQIHLYTEQDYQIHHAKRGNITHIYIISIVGFIVLSLACINFINLTTAQSATRIKEIGLRKTIGATRRQLTQQFIGESVFLPTAAMLGALIFVKLFLPTLNSFTGKTLFLSANLSTLSVIGVTLFVGFLASIYPALVLSAVQPVSALKGNLKGSARGNTFRKGLVIFQLATSIFLIVSTVVVHNQLTYMSDKNLGFDKTHLIHIPIFRTNRSIEPDPKKQLVNRYQTVKSAFLQHPDVTSATVSRNLIGINSGQQRTVQTSNLTRRTIPMWIIEADAHFLDTYKIDLIAGRNLSHDITTDATHAFLINETAAKLLGQTNAIGEQIEIPSLNRTGTVVGIVRNFHGRSLKEKIGPYIICMAPSRYLFVTLRIQTSKMSETMDFLTSTWDRFIPNRPFSFFFLEERIGFLYKKEMRLRTLFSASATVAIVIASLGLIGLATFSTDQRTREMSIRKVLGASTPHICFLLSADFLKWTSAAILIAFPLSYYTMKIWLQNFAYQTQLNPQIFLLIGLLTLAMATATTAYHTFKTATTNPIDTLRSE